MDCNQRQAELQDAIDELVKSHKNTWSAPIPFYVEKVVGQSGSEFVSIPGQCPDILMYLTAPLRGCKVYFSPKTYDPSQGFALGGDKRSKSPSSDWDRLRFDLCNVTMKNGGFHLISNGYCHEGSRKLVCQHAKCYQERRKKKPKEPCLQESSSAEDTTNVENTMNYRMSSFVNDRRLNSRGSNGKKLARRTKTGRPRSIVDVCRFRLTIKYDADGFYLLNTGCLPMHCNHVQLVAGQKPIQSRFLPPQIIETIRTLNTVHACTGIGRDVALLKHNTMLSLQQLHYLHGFSANDPATELCEDTNDVEGATTTRSSADRLISHLCGSGKNNVCILQHRKNVSHDESLASCDNVESSLMDACVISEGGKLIEDSNNSEVSEVLLDSSDIEEMSAFAEEKRLAQKCTNAQKLMIGVAWVSRTAKRWFKLFPHVLFIDVTEDTNKESRPFLTVSVKDSYGHHHVILRAFLPNQRAWSFGWIFQSVMPKLLDKKHLQNVNMCLTDGDSQETSQLDRAIRKYFPQARRRRCAYHLITRRWAVSSIRKRVPEGLTCSTADRSLMMKLLRDWQYSWTDSRTETASEWTISVALFLEFVSSDALSRFATVADVEEILKITRESILPYEDYFSFYRFSDLRCYDGRTTSGHEGTNNGLKRGASSVRPNQALEVAARIIEQKERHHDARATMKCATEYVRSKLWSTSETASYLITMMGESLLLQQQRLAESGELICAKVLTSKMDNTVFHVAKKRCGEQERKAIGNHCDIVVGPECSCPIPQFHRVRIVSVVSGRMSCSCRYFERFGIPCRHMIRVMLEVNPGHQITHHDVSVVYWSSYPIHAHNKEECIRFDDLSVVLSALFSDDIKGPKYPVETENVIPCDVMQLPYDLVPRDAVDSVLNWTPTEVKRALHHNNTQQPQYEEVFFSQQEGSDCSDFSTEGGNAMPAYTSGGTISFNQVTGAGGGPSSYEQVIPYVKDLVKRIDNGGFNLDMTPMLMDFLRDLEKKLNAKEAGEIDHSTPAVGTLVSCHVPTHKRRKTSHGSRWGSSKQLIGFTNS